MVCGFKFGTIHKNGIITRTSDTEVKNYKTTVLFRLLQTKGYDLLIALIMIIE